MMQPRRTPVEQPIILLSVYYPHHHDVKVIEWLLDHFHPRNARIIAAGPILQDMTRYAVLRFVSELDVRRFKNWAREQKYRIVDRGVRGEPL
jgi:hypothetical protein